MIGNGGNLYRGFESLSDFAAEVGLLCLYGEVAEWSKAPAWKVGHDRQWGVTCLEGSNPSRILPLKLDCCVCTERWPSGRRRQPGKLVYGVTCIEGSNPSLSAIDLLQCYRPERKELPEFSISRGM